MSSKSKYWVFTLNNYTDDDRLLLEECVSSAFFSYCCFGLEEGSMESTSHLQGYVESPNRLSLSSLRRLFPRAHWEHRRGSAEQARDYCQKDGDYYEFGEISCPEQGKRNDLLELQTALNNKMPLLQVSNEFFREFLHYRKNIESYVALNQEKRTWQIEVNVYWGKTRTGKSRRAFEEAGPEAWVYPGKGWFDGYYGQDNVVFDDFYGDMPISLLLKVLDDWYPCQVPTKGGHVNWKPRKVWITCNTDPRDLYSGDTVPIAVREALWARLKNVVCFNPPLSDNLQEFYNHFSS